MKQDDELLDSISSGCSVFSYIPENIGKIVYCDSSNPKAEPDSPNVTIRKTILSIIIPVAIAAFCWLVFNESPVFDTIVSIAMVIACFYMVNKCQTFKGTDYFVGTEGCVKLSFDKNRNNIVSKKEVFFKDIDDIITGETRHYRNFSYQGTEYYFIIYAHECNGERKLLDSVEDTYHQEKPNDYYEDQKYRFWKKIENYWTKYKLVHLKDELNQDKPIGFNLYTEKGFCNDYIVFHGLQITIGNVTYDASNIKNLGFKDGALVIEHTNHSSKFFGLIEKGNKSTIPLHMIGNRELFFTFFHYFTSTLQLT